MKTLRLAAGMIIIQHMKMVMVGKKDLVKCSSHRIAFVPISARSKVEDAD
jgi:hypothetical protein